MVFDGYLTKVLRYESFNGHRFEMNANTHKRLDHCPINSPDSFILPLSSMLHIQATSDLRGYGERHILAMEKINISRTTEPQSPQQRTNDPQAGEAQGGWGERTELGQRPGQTVGAVLTPPAWQTAAPKARGTHSFIQCVVSPARGAPGTR